MKKKKNISGIHSQQKVPYISLTKNELIQYLLFQSGTRINISYLNNTVERRPSKLKLTFYLLSLPMLTGWEFTFGENALFPMKYPKKYPLEGQKVPLKIPQKLTLTKYLIQFISLATKT